MEIQAEDWGHRNHFSFFKMPDTEGEMLVRYFIRVDSSLLSQREDRMEVHMYLIGSG